MIMHYSLAIPDCRVAATGGFVGTVTRFAPKYSPNGNYIFWGASVGLNELWFPCFNLPLLKSIGGPQKLSVWVTLSKGSDLNPIFIEVSLKYKMIFSGGFLNELAPIEDPITMEERNYRIYDISVYSPEIVFIQISRISLKFNMNESDEIRLHAAWVEYQDAFYNI